MLHNGDVIGLVGCSDARTRDREADVVCVERLLLERFGIKTIRSTSIFEDEDREASARALDLMEMYQNPEIKAIFDISGGDLANEILPYLDFAVIEKAGKPFVGYSDLTVVLNAIFAKTGVAGWNYQLLHLAGNETELQLRQFENAFVRGENAEIPYEIVSENQDITGTVIGGNIRCLLKLAGTQYLPEPDGEVILLEAMSGNRNKIATFLAQLDQIGYFEKANGIILGTFTGMEKLGLAEEVPDMVLAYTQKYDTFLVRTTVVGHYENAKPCPFGSNFNDKEWQRCSSQSQ
ncbi:LD-carboxypeptidase [Listeria riparia]|uniref:LD-carboxypeptidase family protein n=1 Tax=Listeria riparia FSL S10-1204 TaxID=1265816 RepID=W7D173_9LIST|nr:LD-carboxypeptidase [Listeria riparia]EUJ45579.1 hypothetical protein PRIP_06973 [Listeria riparia FSL S10-1204]